MVCIKCGKDIPIKSKSIKYCSQYCAKLYLKSQYKKRNRERVLEYNRNYKKNWQKGFYKNRGYVTKLLLAERDCCIGCGGKEGLEIHHIRPRIKGGKHEIGNVMLLCKKCHSVFERLTEIFWNK